MNNKKETNYTYTDVMKKVNMAREREKKGFIDYLGYQKGFLKTKP